MSAGSKQTRFNLCWIYIYKKRGACLSPILHIKNFHIARIVEMINAESPMPL